MRKLLFWVAIVAMLYACNNQNSNGNSENVSNNPEITQVLGPDGADLLKILEGKWRSKIHPNNTIEVLDTKIRHLQNNSIQSEAIIDVDGTCLSNPCAVDSLLQRDGWCFTEKSADKTQCFIVLSCDKNLLKFSPIDSEQTIYEFEKVE